MVTRADAGTQADPPSQPADIRPTDRDNVAENSSVNIDVALDQGGIISGTITSSATGSPVSGVNVRAYDSQNAFNSIAFDSSNFNGTYKLTGFSTGTCTDPILNNHP